MNKILLFSLAALFCLLLSPLKTFARDHNKPEQKNTFFELTEAEGTITENLSTLNDAGQKVTAPIEKAAREQKIEAVNEYNSACLEILTKKFGEEEAKEYLKMMNVFRYKYKFDCRNALSGEDFRKTLPKGTLTLDHYASQLNDKKWQETDTVVDNIRISFPVNKETNTGLLNESRRKTLTNRDTEKIEEYFLDEEQTFFSPQELENNTTLISLSRRRGDWFWHKLKYDTKSQIVYTNLLCTTENKRWFGYRNNNSQLERERKTPYCHLILTDLKRTP